MPRDRVRSLIQQAPDDRATEPVSHNDWALAESPRAATEEKQAP